MGDNMELEIFREKDIKTKEWSGGTTSELFIYPIEENYANRNFDFRISTAKINVEKSSFTELKGYNRLIMMLDNSLKLLFNNKTKVSLEPLEFVEFLGEWDTKSEGMGRDFNVMYKDKYSPLIKVFKEKKENILSINKNNFMNFIYVFNGEIELNALNQKELLKKGDFVYIDKMEEDIYFNCLQDVGLIQVIMK